MVERERDKRGKGCALLRNSTTKRKEEDAMVLKNKKKILAIIGICVLFLVLLGKKAEASIYKGNAVLIGMKDADGADRQEGWFGDFDTTNSLLLMKMGGQMSYFSNCSATIGMEYLKKNVCFLIHTHGTQNSVKFTDSSGNVSHITTDMLNNLPSGALSDEILVVYGTCCAGKGGKSANNIVNATYNKGAQHVVGFRDITYVGPMNDFLHQFIHELGTDGETIEEAYDNALFWVKFQNWGFAGGIDDVLIRGTTNVKLVN